MNKILSDANDSLDQANAVGFGTDIQEIVRFREFFEEIADQGMTVSAWVNEWYVEKSLKNKNM